MKCQLCNKPGITICRLERQWPEPKPAFVWRDKETIAEFWLCPDHNWRAADINLALRRSLLSFRVKVNKKMDSFPAKVSVSFSTMFIPDDKGEVTIHRVPAGDHVEVNHLGLAHSASGSSE